MPIFIQVIFHIHISFLVYLEKFDSSKICPIWWLIWRQTIEMLVTNIYMTIVSKSVSFSVLANSNDIAINLMNSNKKLRNTHHPPTSNPRFPEHSTSNLIHGAHTLVPLSILLFLIHVYSSSLEKWNRSAIDSTLFLMRLYSASGTGWIRSAE